MNALEKLNLQRDAIGKFYHDKGLRGFFVLLTKDSHAVGYRGGEDELCTSAYLALQAVCQIAGKGILSSLVTVTLAESNVPIEEALVDLDIAYLKKENDHDGI